MAERKKLFMSAALQKMQILSHFISAGISTAAVPACMLSPSCNPVTKPAHLLVKLDGKSEWEAIHPKAKFSMLSWVIFLATSIQLFSSPY